MIISKIMRNLVFPLYCHVTQRHSYPFRRTINYIAVYMLGVCMLWVVCIYQLKHSSVYGNHYLPWQTVPCVHCNTYVTHTHCFLQVFICIYCVEYAEMLILTS